MKVKALVDGEEKKVVVVLDKTEGYVKFFIDDWELWFDIASIEDISKKLLGEKLVISFSSPLPRKQLSENGIVYTFRTHKRKKSYEHTWANEGRGQPKLYDVRVAFVIEVSKLEQLGQFVDLSGFPHLWDWMAEIKRLNPKMKKFHGYLYHVKRET